MATKVISLKTQPRAVKACVKCSLQNSFKEEKDVKSSDWGIGNVVRVCQEGTDKNVTDVIHRQSLINANINI